MEGAEFRLEREVKFRRKEDGAEAKGILFVGDLQWLEERQCWACHCSLTYVCDPVSRIYGDDPLQALCRALDFLSLLIRGTVEDGLMIWWQYEGDNGGLSFPLYAKETE